MFVGGVFIDDLPSISTEIALRTLEIIYKTYNRTLKGVKHSIRKELLEFVGADCFDHSCSSTSVPNRCFKVYAKYLLEYD
jgi:hypothetical protein